MSLEPSPPSVGSCSVSSQTSRGAPGSFPGSVTHSPILCPSQGILSLSGNSLLLLVAHQKRSLLKPAELFILNLAVSDLSTTVTLFPLATSSSFAHRYLQEQPCPAQGHSLQTGAQEIPGRGRGDSGVGLGALGHR